MYPGNWAETHPDKPAIVMVESGEVRTYRQLDDASNALAHLFRSRGLEVGSHLAILMANRPEYLEACWAAQRSGLYYTPLNWHLTAAEVAYILDDCGAQLLVVDERHAELATELLRERPHISGLAVGVELPSFDRYEEVIAAAPTSRLDDETEGQDMIYTSGTTGRPKGGLRPLPGMDPREENRRLVAVYRSFDMGESTVYLSPGAPLYHAAPLRWAMAQHRWGATSVVMERFDPLTALAAIERHRVTHSQWVPTMFVRLLRLSPNDRIGFDLSSHRMAVHSAAACPVPVKRELMEWWGPIVHEYYGASEGGGVTYIGPQEWLEHPGSVGRPILGAFHILDDDGTELSPGERGTIFYERGIPIAYHNDTEKTRAAHRDDGWSTVGDLGYIDEDGYLYLVGRRQNLIISGGVNIYPQEVEDLLTGHPAVADVAVIGIPNQEYGQEVKAVVELGSDAEPSDELEAELIAFCRSGLATYKAPRSVDFVTELPRAPNGKLYKRRLMEQYWGSADATG